MFCTLLHSGHFAGYNDIDGGAFPLLRLDFNGTAHLSNHFLNDGHVKAASLTPDNIVVDKAIKYVRQGLLAQSSACIFNGNVLQW